MKLVAVFKIIFLLFCLSSNVIFANVAPIITATGNQIYCPQTHQKIVTNVTIVDPDDNSVDAIYIQISAGYVLGQDQLTLTGNHPNLTTQWIPTEGKLKLYNALGNPVLYTEFIAAIKDVEFFNSSATPSGIRNFSISIGQANYLPSNGHYYYYVPQLGITWTDAKNAAAASTYNGLQGYLATITAADEAQLAGAQAAGAGWIGGSDATTEGVWQWVTGPEAGTNFTFTYWNTGEPNNLNDEDYAHITAPGVGLPGSWNDLSNTGNASGDYQPKGYVVEFGGMPGDPVLQLATSTSMTISAITSTTPATRCGMGSVTLQALSSDGIVNWYNAAIGGTLLTTGNSFTTPLLSNNTTYYVGTNCSITRIPVIATINTIPSISGTNSPVTRCGSGPVTLQAVSNVGVINWYNTPTGGSMLFSGANYSIPNVASNSVYYAEAVNNGCSDGTRTAVNITVNAIPNVMDETVILCENQTVVLDAGITGMSYDWSNGQNGQTITVSNPGTYTVNVTSTDNCSNLKTIQVVEYKTPIIQDIEVHQAHVIIHTTNPQGYFEYSIDGVNFQTSNEFTDAPGGLNTAYVRDTYLCKTITKTFIVILIPNFFTPNNDGFNDLWEVKGMYVYPKATVHIFNRFGKNIANLDSSNPQWDGTYNNKELPASDYWFVLELDDTLPIVKGHFTLKR